MCIIVYKPAGKEADIDILEHCWDENPDGAGYMYAEDGHLVINKGYFEFDKFKEAIEPHIGKGKNLLMHFRIATSGYVDTINCHPFIINENLAFMHNGHITKSYDAKSDFSDTLLFCKEILRGMSKHFYKNPAELYLIEKYIGTSKLAFMTNRGRVTIVNRDAGESEGGIWYSNEYYKENRKKKTTICVSSATAGWYGNQKKDEKEDDTAQEEVKDDDKSNIKHTPARRIDSVDGCVPMMTCLCDRDMMIPTKANNTEIVRGVIQAFVDGENRSWHGLKTT